MKIRKLSILVPVYNEVATIGRIYDKLVRLNLGKTDRETIWVDDGSTDGTSKILKKLEMNGLPHSAKGYVRGAKFKYIYHSKNAGKGAAIQSALKKATGNYVIIQDADLEYNPEEIIKLVRAAEANNWLVVFGSRDREIKNKYLYPHYYWGSKMLCWLMNLFFDEKFTDPETCYKLIQTDLLKFMDLTERGFGIEMEMAAKIARIKIPYGEVAISYHPRSFAEGKKINAKDGMRAIYLIGKYWVRDLHYGIVDRILRKIRLAEALKYVRFDREDTVADMGCGRQANLGWRMRPKIKQYIGIDKEVPDLRMAEVKLVQSDLNKKTTLGSESVDIIVAAAILEHLNNPQLFINECRRVLKNGGRLAITTPAPPLADMLLKILVFFKLIEADEVYDHVGYFGIRDLIKLVEKSGLKAVKTERFFCGLNNLIVAQKIK
jgi:dolichol-phosphate mannosyltransferase